MTKIIEWNETQQKEWNEWLSDRPESIKKLADKYPPYNLYKLKTSGQRVTMHSYWEDGTVSIWITGKFNLVMFDKQNRRFRIRDRCEFF